MNTSRVLDLAPVVLFAVAFSHVDPPPTFTSCWQMRLVFIKVCWRYVAVRTERRL